MAFITKIPNRMMYKMFNTNPQSPFKIDNMVGGLNNRSVIVKPNQAMDVRNMDFYDMQIMEKRKGTEQLTQYPSINAEITFLDYYYPYTDTPQPVVASNAHVNFGLNGSNYLSTSNCIQMIDGGNFNGYYFWADGGGLNCYGKFPQSNGTNITVVGTPTNVYQTFKVVSPPNGFTPAPSPATVGVTFYDYNAKQVYYEPCAQEVNDSYKGANVVPLNPRYIETLKGRMYCAGGLASDNQIFIADINNPFYFPNATSVQLSKNSDSIQGLYSFDSSIIIGRQNDIYSLSGDTNNPSLGQALFTMRKLNTQAGLAGNACASVAQNFLYFLGHDGNIYALTSSFTNEKLMASNLISTNLNLFESPFNFTTSQFADAHCAYHNDFWYLSIGDYILVYSFRHQAFTVFDNIKSRDYIVYNGDLLWGTDTGIVCHFSDTLFTDLGVPYKSWWTSGWLDFGDQSNFKHFMEIFCSAQTFANKSDIHLHFEVDYRDSNLEMLASTQRSIWGISKYGDAFVTRDVNYTQPFFLGERGRRMRITFSNGYYLTDSVTNIDAVNNYPGKVEGMLLKETDTGGYWAWENDGWIAKTSDDLNQPMRVYSINGLYEIRGKR